MRSKRIDLIEKYIYKHKTISIDKLCEEFKMSKNTIRRDIDALVPKGIIKKVYGGVTINTNKEILPFDERTIKNNFAKLSIAERSAQLVEDGDSIFIDSGTTTFNMIKYLKDKKNITLFTNNLNAIMQALPYENIEIICLSGKLSRKTSSFTGLNASDVISAYNLNKCFMACTGISLENGVTNTSPEEYKVKKVAVAKSSKCFLLADISKFDVVSSMTFCDIKDLDCIITNDYPAKEYVDYLNNYNIELLIADEKK